MPENLPDETAAKTKRTLDLPPEGKYGLIGREDEMIRLERAFKKAPIVLLTGPAGVGKTELARGFGQRLVDTGNREGGVLFTSFEYGAGLCRVLHEIGTTLQGISFARLSPEQQRRRIIGHFKQNPCLLIWDNLEAVFHSLDPSESQELVDFLQDVADGPSYVLITGRGEDRVDGGRIEYEHEELRGLNEAEASQLSQVILDGAGVDMAVLGPGYSDLSRLLQGNPMSMRVILPHLKGHSPSELAGALGETGQGAADASRSLDAALACSFSLMSARTRTHLPFLALFQQRVLLDVLTFITQGEVYVSVMGEELGWGACRTFLREARDCGILDTVPPSVFLIHPVVSRFLEGQLAQDLTLPQKGVLEQEFVRVYADLGDYFLENLSSDEAESTITGVLAEEANLLRVLHLAETGGQWESAQLILQPLGQVYKMQERVTELRRLRERLLAHLGLEPEQADQKGAIESWMYLQASEINDAIGRLELDKAEGICHQVLRYLDTQDDSSPQAQKASIYHHLGLIAQGRNQAEQAEEWYYKALKINEPLGNEAESADGYHQLGLLAGSRLQYDEAEESHRKSLNIREKLGDEAESAGECYQLGLLAQAQYKFEDAIEWHHKARAGYEHLKDQAGVASIYHCLGLIAQAQYDYEEATGWYQRALLVYEDLDDEPSGAQDYYQLGVIAAHRNEYEEAEEWLHQALAAHEQVGNESAKASCYHQLGVAAHGQARHKEAEERYQKSLEISLGLGDEVAAASTWGQLGLLAEHLGNYPHAIWYVAHTYEIAATRQLPLLRQVKIHLSGLRAKMGTEAFLKCWQEVSDSDVLSELEST